MLPSVQRTVKEPVPCFHLSPLDIAFHSFFVPLKVIVLSDLQLQNEVLSMLVILLGRVTVTREVQL